MPKGSAASVGLGDPDANVPKGLSLTPIGVYKTSAGKRRLRKKESRGHVLKGGAVLPTAAESCTSSGSRTCIQKEPGRKVVDQNALIKYVSPNEGEIARAATA